VVVSRCLDDVGKSAGKTTHRRIDASTHDALTLAIGGSVVNGMHTAPKMGAMAEQPSRARLKARWRRHRLR
jgi:hypothetical protein